MKILKHNRGASGFTVMELVVVIAVAMLITGIAVPSFLSWLPTLRLSNGARQVATDLQLARMKAISQNAKFRLNFTSGTSYEFQKDNSGFGYESGPFSLPEGITVTETTPFTTSEFQPRGTANTGVGISTITLSNGSDTKQVAIKLVGRVNVL